MIIKHLVWRKIEGGEHYVSVSPWRSDFWVNLGEDGLWHASFLDYARGSEFEKCETLRAAQDWCQELHNKKIMQLLD